MGKQWSFVPSTKIAITKQKIDFWPQISKFWGQKSTFSPLAANWSLNDQCFQHEKVVSLESRYEGTKIFTPCPQKIGFGAQKRPNLAQNWHFGPNIGIFGPLDIMPDQKTMRTSCQSGFLLCWYQNFYLLPQKLGILAQKRPNLVQNMHFWSFWAKYCHFLHILSNDWPKIGIFGQFGPGHAGFFGALLVGRLVVVARGLYLARHLFTLFKYCTKKKRKKFLSHSAVV